MVSDIGHDEGPVSYPAIPADGNVFVASALIPDWRIEVVKPMLPCAAHDVDATGSKSVVSDGAFSNIALWADINPPTDTDISLRKHAAETDETVWTAGFCSEPEIGNPEVATDSSRRQAHELRAPREHSIGPCRSEQQIQQQDRCYCDDGDQSEELLGYLPHGVVIAPDLHLLASLTRAGCSLGTRSPRSEKSFRLARIRTRCNSSNGVVMFIQ